jgi:hypothetical protein
MFDVYRFRMSRSPARPTTRLSKPFGRAAAPAGQAVTLAGNAEEHRAGPAAGTARPANTHERFQLIYRAHG